MANTIGFKVTDNKLATIDNVNGEDMDGLSAAALHGLDDQLAEKLLHTKGRMLALEVLTDYFNPYAYPGLSGESRNKHFMKKLAKIRERYFEPL